MNKAILASLFFSFLMHAGFSQVVPDPLASPIQSGAYIPGIMTPRDYANPGFSGLIAIDYNIYFNTDSYFDEDGNEVNSIELPFELGVKPLEIDISGYMNSLSIAYVSPELEFLGNARYLGFVSPYYSTADFRVALSEIHGQDLEVKGGAGGIGDLSITPLLLTWTGNNDKFDVTTGYMFSAPTGRFENGADDNIGLGYWSHDFQLFGYYYLLEKATALFVANTFETHGKVKDVDVRPGNRFSLEYGLSQYLSEKVEVTVQGGNMWQVGEDSGDDVYWDATVMDKFSTIGAGLGYWALPDKLYLNLNWRTNYAIAQHFGFNAYELQLIYIPGILGE